MKIAFFHNLPSGGAKRALHGFMKQLSGMEHRLDLFVPSTADESYLTVEPFAQKIVRMPVNKSALGMLKSSIRYVLPFKYSLADLEMAERRLADQINAGDYDVIFVEQDRYTMSPFVLRYLKKPHLYYCPQPSRLRESAIHSNEEAVSFLKRSWRKHLRSRIPAIDRDNALHAKYIATNSQFSRDQILKAYGTDSFVCYLGVDIDLFKKRELPARDYVLSVGSIEPIKGYDFLIRALGRMEASKRVPLRIVANSENPAFRTVLEQLAEKHGVRLEIHSLVSDEELVRMYSEAALFVYAPHMEPFGLAALEAMSCGLCVVGVKEGGLQESIIDQQTGYLIERNEQQFADTIVSLLQDAERRRVTGDAAAARIREFWTLRHAAERLLDHLRSAISAQR